ncbi:MAG TPA: hypothetical protein VGE79_01640, partial [Niastella sp.]
LRLQTCGLNRCVFSIEGTESTGNAGSDLSIGRYNDAGTQIESAFWLKRSTGNLGLGITAPTERLHVNGNIISQVTGANSTIVSRSTSTGDAILTTDVSGVSASSFKTFRTGGRTGIINNSIEAISILTNGNVGINNTAPAHKLEVAGGNIRATNGNIQVGPTDASVMTALTYSTRLGVVGTFTNSPFAIYTNSTERVRIDSLGKVGIGTNNPGAKLQVTNGTQSIQFGTGTNTSNYTSSLGANDDGFNFSNNVATRGFNFKNSNGTLLSITNDGKVGINNTAPGSKLDVAGVMRVGMNSGPSDFPATGAGLSMSYNGVGYIDVQDKTNGTYKDLQLQASNISLVTNEGTILMHGSVAMDGDLTGVNNISSNGGIDMNGDLNNANNITANGKVTAAGDVSGKRYLTKTSSLAFTANANTTAILGTGYSVTVTGGDAFMKVTIRTGTGITTTGTIGTIAFSTPFPNIPAVVWSANDINAMDAKIGFTSSSVNNITIFNKTALAASTTYTYSIMVGGW